MIDRAAYKAMKSGVIFRFVVEDNDAKSFRLPKGGRYFVQSIPKPVNMVEDNRDEIIEILHINST